MLSTIDLLNTIITKCQFIKSDIQVAQQVIKEYIQFFSMLIDKDIDNDVNNELFKNLPKTPPITEDLYLSLLNLFTNFFNSIEKLLLLFQDFELSTNFYHLIFTLLKLAKNHDYYKIRSEAFDLISKIYLKMVDLDFSDYDFEIVILDKDTNSISDLIASSKIVSFSLPGITSAIIKIINLCSNQDYYKVHSSVILSALKLFSIVTQFAFWNGIEFHETTERKTISSESYSPYSPFAGTINKAWFEQTLEKLNPITLRLIDCLLQHPDSLVQFSLFKFCINSILNCCNEFVIKIIRTILKVPLFYYSMTFDDNLFLLKNDQRCSKPIIDASKKFVDNFYKDITTKFDKSDSDANSHLMDLKNLLHEELYCHIKKIPYLMRNIDLISNSDEQIMQMNIQIVNKSDFSAAFRIFIGYMAALDQNGFYDFIKIEQHKYLLFRSLINVAQFNYTTRLSSILIEYQDFNYKFDNSELSNKQDIVTIKELFSNFQLEKQLIYLDDSTLSSVYLTSIIYLVKCCNYNSLQIVMDHLCDLLRSSNNDPSVMLVINAIICGFSFLDYKEKLYPYLKEILSLYNENFSITDLYAAHYFNENGLSSDSDILRITNEESSQEPNKSKSVALNKKILQHCFAMQGTALLYFTFNSSEFRNDFYQNWFCRFIESLASNYKFISNIAHKSLVFVGQSHFTNTDSQIVLHQMIMDNMDYIYSKFAVTFDYSILLQRQTGSSITSYNYIIDRYPLKTAQISLQTILRLHSNYHQSIGKLDEQQLSYFHRLIDQILNIIKHYYTCPNETYSDNINNLLMVLHEYLQLMTTVFDSNYVADLKRISSQPTISVDDIIDSLVDFTENCQIMFKTSKELEIPEDEETEDIHSSKVVPKEENILESPILSSRIGNILYTCSLLLADSNLTVRCNVIELASMSMRLLRSYEGCLKKFFYLQILLEFFYRHPTTLCTQTVGSTC